METQGPAGDTRLGAAAWRRIGLFWLLIALAWAPAAAFTSGERLDGPAGLLLAFAVNLLHFAPWALSIPLLLRLSRAWPIGLGRSARHAALFVLIGAALIPAFATVSVVAGRALVMLLRGLPADSILSGLSGPILVTGLFAIPTYVAVLGIAQTIAYLERFRQREHLLSEARAQALRAQIAPHFLFNALNAISALGYSEPARADEAMVRLSGLLRQTFERGPWSTLREEIGLVADYVELHRLLLGDRLTFDLAIAPDAWDAPLPTMLLQPLIENALVHGISSLPEGGTLSVSAAIHDGEVRVEIVNDMPSDGSSRPGAGLGLTNVRERIEASFGDRGGVSLALDDGFAFAVLSIPRLAAPPS